jgi:hypothetical protein
MLKWASDGLGQLAKDSTQVVFPFRFADSSLYRFARQNLLNTDYKFTNASKSHIPVVYAFLSSAEEYENK